MRRQSAQERQERYIARADEAFETHELKSRTGSSRWTIKRADDSVFHLTDLLWLPRGFWLIHGDIPAMLVLTRQGNTTARLAWIGNSDPRYMAEKAGEAMRMPDFGFEYDTAVAAHELAAMIDENPNPPAAWREGLKNLDEYGFGVEEVMRDVWEATDDCEFEIGKVVNGRIYYAQAAARCLLRLLRAETPQVTNDGEVA